MEFDRNLVIVLNYEPQGASGPGRRTTCSHTKNAKRINYGGPKRLDDTGKALTSTIDEKTRGRGGR